MIMLKTKNSAEISKMPVEELVSHLGTDLKNGLSSSEAADRLLDHGLNVIAEPPKYGLASIILKEIREPMIVLLIIVGAIYSLLGEPGDSIVIIVVVVLVVLVESYNVFKARRSMNALRQLSATSTTLVRDGKAMRTSAVNLVTGDIVIIAPGDRIPADGRLIESYNLKIDESSLTGESMPVSKDADQIPASNNLAELSNMAFGGTMAVQGTARMLVTSTGKDTEIGRISTLVAEEEEPVTPLEESMKRLAEVLASLAIFLSFCVPLIGYFQGQSLDTMILTGLSMAFATVPEELPVLVSMTLAVGAYFLSKQNAVVKNLRAAETLGRVTVIATDKTGTITEGKMSIGHIVSGTVMRDSSSAENADLARIGILATGTMMLEATGVNSYKDPMEVAIYEYSKTLGVKLEELKVSYLPVDEFQFDNKIKLTSFLYRTQEGGMKLFVSGAPEVVLSRSKYLGGEGDPQPINYSVAASVNKVLDDLSSSGERVIAIASRSVKEITSDRNLLERDLTYHGMISFADPPRKEAKKAIEECQDAGIRVIMLTGDHPKTARAIASQVGMNGVSSVITGQEMATMDDEKLSLSIKTSTVFARITSEDKFRIVQLLRKRGEVVAVTGDGVNDAPALRTAEIGVAMGKRGTEAAREASDMILLDDDFSTIVDAVHEGRKIMFTLRKGITYEISIKIALVLILLIPILLVVPFPFSPIQIIIAELLMDVVAIGAYLAEMEEPGLMKQPPRRNNRSFIDRPVALNLAFSALAVTVAVAGIYLYVLYSSGSLVRAQTAAFAAWLLAQLFLAYNLRTEKEPIFLKGFFSNRVINVWALMVILMMVALTAFPDLQVIMHTYYLTASDWILIILGTAASGFWLEAYKLVNHFLAGKPHKTSV